jgi:hypothetical protein
MSAEREWTHGELVNRYERWELRDYLFLGRHALKPLFYQDPSGVYDSGDTSHYLPFNFFLCIPDNYL